jgi:long-chain fatty acid transport protein
MKYFKARKLAVALGMMGICGLSTQAGASAFQLWEQDAASVGNYHAGYAAAAYDASTAFYNPAGLTRFKNQQLVLAGSNVFTNFKYKGTVSVDTLDAGAPVMVSAQGGNYGFVPAMHYVAPLSDQIAFGLSVAVPFGLKTNYGYQTNLRYATTETSVQVIDISPVLSFKLSDHLSFGLGPNLQLMKGTFNQVGVFGDNTDSDGINNADGSGYGLHGGLLYEFDENIRVGMSYHSQVVHHLSGTSTLGQPLADMFTEVPPHSARARVDVTLPAYTALSAYYKIRPKVALMASVIYTQWNCIRNLVLQNVVGIVDTTPSTSVVASLPLNFKNSYNFSVGSDYMLTDAITLRAGLGYDQTPVSNAYRTARLPDNNRYAIALGGHYQAMKTLGLDLGWTHIFINKAHVIPPPQVVGDETVATNGSVTGGANVVALQVVWDML